MGARRTRVGGFGADGREGHCIVVVSCLASWLLRYGTGLDGLGGCMIPLGARNGVPSAGIACGLGSRCYEYPLAWLLLVGV
jgi:hypothetical protein